MCFEHFTMLILSSFERNDGLLDGGESLTVLSEHRFNLVKTRLKVALLHNLILSILPKAGIHTTPQMLDILLYLLKVVLHILRYLLIFGMQDYRERLLRCYSCFS